MGFEAGSLGREGIAMRTPEQFAAAQFSTIRAFVPQLFLLGVGAYILAGGIRKITNGLGLTKEK